MAILLENTYPYGTQDGIPNSKPHYQIQIEDGDTISEICALLKISYKASLEAYWKPVNKNAPNGVQIDSDGPNDIKAGKIFYIPYDGLLNKRVNIHKVFNTNTTIRCLYGPDEPMRNRFVLFWEINEAGDGFRENGSGSYYGRKGANGEITKPIGLGITDGDGILNGESLRWISDGDNKNIVFKNNGAFPEHAKKTDISFVCKLYEPNMYIEEKNHQRVMAAHRGEKIDYDIKIGSSFVHNLKPKNTELYDIGEGNFIWKENVSRFTKVKKYSFMPLPVDIFNIRSFETVSLFDEKQKLFKKSYVPNEIETSDSTRDFFIIDKERVNKIMGDFKFDYDKRNKFFEIPDNLKDVSKKPYPPEFKEYATPTKNFKYKSYKRLKNKYSRFRKLITEETPPIKNITFDKLTLPEWLARIQYHIKICNKSFEAFSKRAVLYTDTLMFADKIEKFSSIVLRYPCPNKPTNITPPLTIKNTAIDLKNNVTKVLKDNSDKKLVEEFKDFERKVDKLYKLVHSSSFVQESVDYLSLKVNGIPISKEKRIAIIKGSDSLEKKHHKEILNQLSKVLFDSYDLFKKTDIYNLKTGNHDNSIASKSFNNYYKIVVKGEEPANKLNQPLFLIKDGLMDKAGKVKDFLGKYVVNTPGPPSLLVALANVFGPYLAEYYMESDQGGVHKRFKKLIDLYAKKFMLTKEFNNGIKIIKNFLDGGVGKNKYINEKDFSDNFFKRDKYGKLGKLVGTGSKGFFFLMNLYSFAEHINGLRNATSDQQLDAGINVLNSALNANISYIGLFSKATEAVKSSKIIKLGIIGFTLSTFLLLREHARAREIGDSRGQYLALTEISLGLVGLYFVRGLAGGAYWNAAYILISFLVYPSLKMLFYGGPTEEKLYKWCIQFSGNRDSETAYNKIIKSNSSLDRLFKKLLNEIKQLTNFTGQNAYLSWRAAIPLIAMGYHYADNKGKINYELTESMLSELISTPEWTVKPLLRSSKRNHKEVTEHIKVKKIVLDFKNTAEQLEKAEDKNTIYDLNEKLNKMKKGTYKKKVLPHKNYVNGIEVFDFIPEDYIDVKVLSKLR